MDEARHMLDGVVFCQSAYDTLEGSDALVILTEWNEFRALDLDRVKSLLSAPIVVDLRNIYNPADMIEAGFHYSSIGRPGSAELAARKKG
jgi:UDPglucose 6-dehydrogenase